MDRHKLGLIGYPLSHTFSPSYFSKKFESLGYINSEYKAYSIPTIDDLQGVLEQGVTGLNVTIPYKEKVIPFLDELSDEAFEVGAVNTIKIVNGRLIGYNTDVLGFVESLKKLINGKIPETAFILGTGGAAKAVKYGLLSLGIKPIHISRSTHFKTYAEITKADIAETKLIVNTTPLGMYPNVEECPDIPYEHLTKDHFLYDLVYNPEKTLFLKKGALQGARVKNGYDMLILQAEKAWTIWNPQ